MTHATEAGVVMEPRLYVPEQVRGIAVDARSDIFSFGTILYEMISGNALPPRHCSRYDERHPEEDPADLSETIAMFLPR